MKGDYTRLTFDKTKHYRGVLMQQGRLQLDADWNEQVQIAEHRYSTFFRDVVGRSGAPEGNALGLSFAPSKALMLGGKAYIIVSDFSDLRSAVTLKLWFRVGNNRLRDSYGCILNIWGLAAFGVKDNNLHYKLSDGTWNDLPVQVDANNGNYLTVRIAKTDNTIEIQANLDEDQVYKSQRIQIGLRNQPILEGLTVGSFAKDSHSITKSEQFNGAVAELRVWHGQDNPQESILSSNLIRYYPFNEANKATTAIDYSPKKINADIHGEVTSVNRPGMNGAIHLSKGSYYVNGFLIENEEGFDLPQPEKEKADGWYLYYLDAWSREVAAAEDANLLDPAFGGADTTTRIKTEWNIQCKNIGAPETALEDLIGPYSKNGWPDSALSDWQCSLSTGTMQIVKTDTDIKNNRLYRVEVHQGSRDEHGKAITPVFKWSRDNGSVAAAAGRIEGNIIALAAMHDAFKGALWVEVSDQKSRSQCKPGSLVALSNDKANNLRKGILTIKNWHGRGGQSSFEESVIVRRWDGVLEGVHKTDLEEGLSVQFKAGDDVLYRSGDYWQMVVRDTKVQNWISGKHKSPDGIEHHYAALGLVKRKNGIIDTATGKDGIVDLRILFDSLTNPDLSTTGNVRIGGRLDVGSRNITHSASLNVTSGNGPLIRFETSEKVEAGRITHNQGGSLSITDAMGNGVTIKHGGTVGIGSTTTGGQLEINGGDLSLKASSGKPDDPGDIIFLDSNGKGKQKARIYSNPHSGPGLYFCTNEGNFPNLSIDDKGNVDIGTKAQGGQLVINGGDLSLKANSGKPDDPGDIIFSDSNGKGKQKARIYSNPHSGPGLNFSTNEKNYPNISIDDKGKVDIGTKAMQEGKLVIQQAGQLVINGNDTCTLTLHCPGNASPAQDLVKSDNFLPQSILIGGYVCESCIHIYWKDQNGKSHMGTIESKVILDQGPA